MRNRLRDLAGKHEVFGCLFVPPANRLLAGDSIEGRVHFNGLELLASRSRGSRSSSVRRIERLLPALRRKRATSQQQVIQFFHHGIVGHRPAVPQAGQRWRKRIISPKPASSAVSNQFHLSSEIKRLAVEAGFDLAGCRRDPQHSRTPLLPRLDRRRPGGRHALPRSSQRGRRSEAGLSRQRCSLGTLGGGLRAELQHRSALLHPCRNHLRKAGSRATRGPQRDYHDVVLAKLRALEAKFVSVCEQHEITMPRTWCYVDTGPVIERIFAKYAGIGWIGKNTCILNQELGSWLFLGVMLTSLELTPDLPPADRCGSCTRCLDSCPTGAFPAPYQLDATKCISYLTIEKRGAIPQELRTGVGRQVFGCDICQDVCPWNRQAPITRTPEFTPRQHLVNPDLEWLARLSLEQFREAVSRHPGQARQVHRPAAQCRYCHG